MGKKLKVKCGTSCRFKMRCMYQFSCNFQLGICFLASLHARLWALLYHKMPLTITKRPKKALFAICILPIHSSMDRRRRRNRFYLTGIYLPPDSRAGEVLYYHHCSFRPLLPVAITVHTGGNNRVESCAPASCCACLCWTWGSATCSQAKCRLSADDDIYT